MQTRANAAINFSCLYYSIEGNGEKKAIATGMNRREILLRAAAAATAGV